jgi:5-methylcytosine-specific restriction endonuclease McrA
MRRWLVWRRSARADSSGRYGKLPYNVADKRADYTNPAEWRTFDEAVRQFQRGPYDGIGLVLGDGLCGLDEDDCLTDGTLDPGARRHIEHLNSYAEISPSRKGVKCLAFGSLPEGRRRIDKHELYDSKRFWTVTGWNLSGFPRTVEHRERELHELHRMIFDAQSSGVAEGVLEQPATVPKTLPNTQRGGGGTVFSGSAFSVSEKQVIEMLRRDAVARPLLERGHKPGGDESAEDFAFASKLAFFTGKNLPLMERIFRTSPLANRPKARSRRGDGDYITLTLQRACAEQREVWKPSRREGGMKGKGGRPPCGVGLDTVLPLRRAGMSLGEIAKRCGIGKTTVKRLLDQEKVVSCVPKPFQNSEQEEDRGEVPAGRCETLKDPAILEVHESESTAPMDQVQACEPCSRCGNAISPKFIAGRCCHCYWTESNWKRRFDGNRPAVIERDGGACSVCGQRAGLIVHHRRPGHNDPELLLTICRACHAKVHGMQAIQRYENPFLVELWAEQHPMRWKQGQFSFPQDTESLRHPSCR